MLTSFNSDSLHHSLHHRPLKILFAGGCHVAGYPIGEELSFPSLVRDRLLEAGIGTEIHRLSHLKLGHRRRLVAACRESGPDVVVLQAGHDVLNRKLSSHIRAMFGCRHRKTEDSDIPASFVSSPAAFYSKAVCKAVIDRLLGHPLVDFGQFEKQLGELVAELKKCGVPLIVMLTPLGCADLTTSYYRRRSLASYERVAREHCVELVRVLADAPRAWQRHFGTADYYYDAIHLGAAGHRLAGQAIASRIREMVFACTAKQASV